MSTMNKVPSKHHSDYFSVLPDELMIKIVAQLRIRDVLNFVGAYPKFRHFGEDKCLKVKIIACYDENKSFDELQDALNPKRKIVGVQLGSANKLFKTSLLRDIFQLLPYLQVIYLNNCKLPASICSTDDHCTSDRCFWKILFARVKAVTFDSCKYSTMESFPAWYLWIFTLEKHLTCEPNKILSPKVTLGNTLPIVPLNELSEKMNSWIQTGLLDFLEKYTITVEAENKSGESLTLATINFPTESGSLWNRFQGMRLFAFFQLVWWQDGITGTTTSLPQQNLREIQVVFTSDRTLIIKISEDFDMEELKADLEVVHKNLELLQIRHPSMLNP